MHIRSFQTSDVAALWQVFHSAVHQLTQADYNEAQRLAWAPHTPDMPAWAARMQALQPFVAVDEQGQVVGYADLQGSGYIDHFFIAASASNTGTGRLLMHYIESQARQRGLTQLSADVSLTAQGFFQHFGFVIIRQQNPVIRGVSLSNAHMVKKLHAQH